MRRRYRFDLARMRSRLGIVIAVVIGFLGWFTPFLSSGAPDTAIATTIFGLVTTGAVGAAIGRRSGLRWLLLGFLLPPILVVVSARLSPPIGEGSGFAFVEYSMLGLVLVCLGFYGWLGVRKIMMARRPEATRDIRQR